MTPRRLEEITSQYGRLRVVVIGDLCLDRYLHIDPSVEEISAETNLPVHNVVAVRPQPGGAGNVLANVTALGPAEAIALGICGLDGEGFELRRAMEQLGADLSRLVITRRRLTFTYTKPLLVRPGQPPEELNRLDIRSRQPLERDLEEQIIAHLRDAGRQADVVLAMDQVPQPQAGVLTRRVKRALAAMAQAHPGKAFLADSRSDVGAFEHVRIKVNRAELLAHFHASAGADLRELACRWSGNLGQDVFVTLAQEGILVASGGSCEHVKAVPVEGDIDVVGAGDAVFAHIGMALAGGANPVEAGEIAMLAGSIVVKKVGTTGTATVEELTEALGGPRP